MQLTLEADSTSVLGVPYGATPERRFWNLKNHPELIDRISELEDYPELKDFVRAVNRPDSRFATLGCEKWSKDVDYPNGATRECGAYIDIVFDTIELCGHENYDRLADEAKRYGDQLREQDQSSDLTLIRMEPKRVGFYAINASGWMVAVWIYGVGNSEEMAAGYRSRGLREFLVVLNTVSAEVERGLGRQGTSIFDRLNAFEGPDS